LQRNEKDNHISFDFYNNDILLLLLLLLLSTCFSFFIFNDFFLIYVELPGQIRTEKIKSNKYRPSGHKTKRS